MRERKVINKLFALNKCIETNTITSIYDTELNNVIEKESENGWCLHSCTPTITPDNLNIVYTLIFEKDNVKDNAKAYNGTKLQPSPIIRDNKEYTQSNMEKFRKLEEDLNEMFVNKVKSDDYENVPKYINDIINEDIKSNGITIFKNDFTFVPHYHYSEYMKEKHIRIDEPKQITNFIHAVVRIVGKEFCSFYYALYRELEKWNSDKYKVIVEWTENEAYINIIYFKPLIGPRGD